MILTSLGQLDFAGRYTYEDYLNWDFPQRVELILGKVFPMSPAPSIPHQDICLRVSNRLLNFFDSYPCRVIISPVDVIFPGPNGQLETVLQPDIIVVCDQTKITPKNCLGAPDLVVEVLSKSSRKRDREFKFMVYEMHGVREYWIIDPEQCNMVVYRLEKNGRFERIRLSPYDSKFTSELFPGLEIDLAYIFQSLAGEPRLLYHHMRKKELRMIYRNVVRI